MSDCCFCRLSWRMQGLGFFFLAGITLLNYKLRRKVCVTAKDTKVLPNKLLNIKSITKLPGFIVLRLSKGENAKEKQQCEKNPSVYVKSPPVRAPSKFVGHTNSALQNCFKLMLKIIILWESPLTEEPFQHWDWTNIVSRSRLHLPGCALRISQNIQTKGWKMVQYPHSWHSEGW